MASSIQTRRKLCMGKYFSAASNRGQSLGEEVANSISHGFGVGRCDCLVLRFLF